MGGGSKGGGSKGGGSKGLGPKPRRRGCSTSANSISGQFDRRRPRLPKAGDAFTNTVTPRLRVSTGFHVKHHRPKAGNASPEGLLKVERRVFRCLGV